MRHAVRCIAVALLAPALLPASALGAVTVEVDQNIPLIRITPRRRRSVDRINIQQRANDYVITSVNNPNGLTAGQRLHRHRRRVADQVPASVEPQRRPRRRQRRVDRHGAHRPHQRVRRRRQRHAERRRGHRRPRRRHGQRHARRPRGRRRLLRPGRQRHDRGAGRQRRARVLRRGQRPGPQRLHRHHRRVRGRQGRRRRRLRLERRLQRRQPGDLPGRARDARERRRRGLRRPRQHQPRPRRRRVPGPRRLQRRATRRSGRARSRSRATPSTRTATRARSRSRCCARWCSTTGRSTAGARSCGCCRCATRRRARGSCSAARARAARRGARGRGPCRATWRRSGWTTAALRRATLRPGTKLTVTITAAETTGRTFTYTRQERRAARRRGSRAARRTRAGAGHAEARPDARAARAARAGDRARRDVLDRSGTTILYDADDGDSDQIAGVRRRRQDPLHPLRRRRPSGRTPAARRATNSPQTVDCPKARRHARSCSTSSDGDDIAAVERERHAPGHLQRRRRRRRAVRRRRDRHVQRRAGNDNIVARDGQADVRVDCGGGNDTAITDDADTRISCEQVEGDADGDGVRVPADCDDTRPDDPAGRRPTSRTTGSTRTAPASTPSVPTATATARRGPQDCNDGDAAVRPGAGRDDRQRRRRELRRPDRPVPADPRLAAQRLGPARQRHGEPPAAASGSSRNTAIEMRCDGRRCPFEVVRRGSRAAARRSICTRRSATACCRAGPRSSCGSRSPNRIGRVLRYTIGRPGDAPDVEFLCLPPGGRPERLLSNFSRPAGLPVVVRRMIVGGRRRWRRCAAPAVAGAEAVGVPGPGMVTATKGTQISFRGTPLPTLRTVSSCRLAAAAATAGGCGRTPTALGASFIVRAAVPPRRVGAGPDAARHHRGRDAATSRSASGGARR